MKKRILGLVLTVAMLLSAFAFTACQAPTPEKEEHYSRMTVDINPSVEFMVDGENKVVSVTALNDDGAVLIAGEAFVGKTAEEATELMVTLATETGYLVKGNVTADENTVKLSVSGDSETAAALLSDIEAKAASTLESLDVEGKVAKAEAMTVEAARALYCQLTGAVEEQVAELDFDELYKEIALRRTETALLLTEEMRSAYYSAKETRISFAESEATAAVINAMGDVYQLIYSGYKFALDSYSEAITKLDEFRYERLVSPDSTYQKTLLQLREAKGELLKEKNYVATLEVNGEEYASATLNLQSCQDAYDKMLLSYETLGSELNAKLEDLIAVLRKCEETLRSLEDKFSKNIKDELKAKAVDIENAINTAKDGFFAEFEEAHGEDIEAACAALVEQKNKLKASVESK